MSLPSLFRRPLSGAALLFVCCAAVGCGGDKTHRVSGKVTFQGKPVPSGRISFKPDDSKGNVGANGYAEIKNGEFDTRLDGGRGVGGGPTVVLIEGFEPVTGNKSDEVMSKPLFPPYQVLVDLGAGDVVKDFDVPKDAPVRPTEPGRVVDP